MAKNHKRRNGKKSSQAKIALQNGIVPLRRKVARESYEVLSYARRNLRPEVRGGARFYQSNDVAVTVVGLTRLDNGHLNQAPQSKEIIKEVKSCSKPVRVTLGEIAVFGNNKLAFHVESEEIKEEEAGLEAAYRERGFDLAPFPHDKNTGEEGRYKPHCTIGSLYSQAAAHLEDKRAREHYDRIADVRGSMIILQGIELPLRKLHN